MTATTWRRETQFGMDLARSRRFRVPTSPSKNVSALVVVFIFRRHLGAFIYEVRKIFGFWDHFPLVIYRIHKTSFLLSAFWGLPSPHPLRTSYMEAHFWQITQLTLIGSNIASASKLLQLIGNFHRTCQDFEDLRNLIYRRSITRIIRSMKAFSRWRTLKQRINRCRDDDKPNGQQERSKGPHHCARPELGLVWRRKSRVRENCARVRNWTEEPSRLWSLEGGDDFKTTRRHATHAKAFG